jgi:hypothetical protein
MLYLYRISENYRRPEAQMPLAVEISGNSKALNAEDREFFLHLKSPLSVINHFLVESDSCWSEESEHISTNYSVCIFYSLRLCANNVV